LRVYFRKSEFGHFFTTADIIKLPNQCSALETVSVYIQVYLYRSTVFDATLRNAGEFLSVDAYVIIAGTIGTDNFISFYFIFSISQHIFDEIYHCLIVIVNVFMFVSRYIIR